MRTYTIYVGECQFIRSMMSLRRSYDFDYAIRPGLDISLGEAGVRFCELKTVSTSQLVADWRKAYALR